MFHKIILIVTVLAGLVAGVPSVQAQQPSPALARVSPVVVVQLKPIPARLKPKLRNRPVLSSGVAPFGVNANPIWVVSLAGGKPKKQENLGQGGTVEFWQWSKTTSYRLLRRLVLPAGAGHSLSASAGEIQLRWLFPSQRRGPVVVFPSPSRDVVLYAFEKGWHDPKPINQRLQAVNSYASYHIYDFDSVDEKGVLQGMAFIPYFMTSAEDNPGEWYTVRWKSGFGWE